MEQTKSEQEIEYHIKIEEEDRFFRKMKIVGYFIFALLVVGAVLWKITKLIVPVALFLGVVWFWYGVRKSRRMNAEIQEIKAQLYGNEQKPITHAVFQDLLEEYADNQLEPLYRNEFFSSWKLTYSDDAYQNISLVFTKRGHEISMDISDDGVSILFDEEAGDTCVEFGWEDDTLKTAYDVYPRITEECRRTYEEILRAEQAKHT